MYTKIIDDLQEFFPPEEQIISSGTKMQIHLREENDKLVGRMVGLVREECLIIRVTDRTELSTLKGRTVHISYLYEGCLVEFESVVMEILTSPSLLLFLQFPLRINKKTLRSLDRTPCLLPSIIYAHGEGRKCILTNISDSGCSAVIKINPVIAPPVINNSDIIKLTFTLPGYAKEIVTGGKVRNINKTAKEFSLGIQFSEINDKIRDKIRDFIDSLN